MLFFISRTVNWAALRFLDSPDLLTFSPSSIALHGAFKTFVGSCLLALAEVLEGFLDDY